MGSERVEKEVSVEKKLEAKIWSTERAMCNPSRPFFSQF